MQPHDELFKATFSHREVALGYLRERLPAALLARMDLDSLQIEPGSYIRGDLSEHFSDLVYRVKLRNGSEASVSLLFEHKHRQPKYPFLQLLRYIVAALDQMEKQDEDLRPVIPVVVYHGKNKWQYKPITDYFRDLDPVFFAYIPTFDYLVEDIQCIPDTVLLDLQTALLRKSLLLFKHGQNWERLERYLVEIFTPDSDGEAGLLQSFIVYVFRMSNLPSDSFMEKISTLPPKTRQKVKSLYDQILEKGEREGERIGIEKGERIGIEKGERIGIEKTKLFTIWNGWENGVDVAIIATLLSCSSDEVQGWYKRFDAGEQPNL